MKPKPVNGLPYRTRVYLNNQVLLPANLVRALGIEGAKYADVVIKYGDKVIEVRNAKLLRTRHTASRQFTIPREIREKYGVGLLDEVEIVQVKPKSTMEVIKDTQLH
jgi:hypothetical protein